MHFFSLEESRMHVHVTSADGEAKIWMEPEIELARAHRLSAQDVNRIVKLVTEAQREIREVWNEHFPVEVTNISQHGFWVLVDDRELFLPFDQFPWFKAAAVQAIHNVERPQPQHLYWPDLDVDLTIDSIEHPERYPLRACVRDDV